MKTVKNIDRISKFGDIDDSKCKRTGNYALPVRSDIWDAGVHVNKVDTCDGEQLRSVEWFGVGTQARWALPL